MDNDDDDDVFNGQNTEPEVHYQLRIQNELLHLELE